MQMVERPFNKQLIKCNLCQMFNVSLFLCPCCGPAPEMVKGDVVGPPADLWALGVITYIMWVSMMSKHHNTTTVKNAPLYELLTEHWMDKGLQLKLTAI